MLEPQENGMIDLPDYEHIEDETFPPFPPPASPERQDGEGAEPDEGSGAPIPVPPRRTVKRNIPKLDAQRLISERGNKTVGPLYSWESQNALRILSLVIVSLDR
uniref:TIMELESS-interacting protein n=1 Tax=Prolemur simus TaxID=1328070 RepID=A0A8C8ZER8_PROSS